MPGNDKCDDKVLRIYAEFEAYVRGQYLRSKVHIMSRYRTCVLKKISAFIALSLHFVWLISAMHVSACAEILRGAGLYIMIELGEGLLWPLNLLGSRELDRYA